MLTIWGIHNDQPSLDLVEGGFISIGWKELGDPRAIGPDREQLKLRLAATYPNAKPGAIPVWAGVVARFMDDMQIGDYIISPNKADRTLNVGRIASEYYYDQDSADLHPNRRKVTWLR